MDFDKKTPKKEITIKGVVLTVISPFAEGHVLTAEEANVLNQTLAENLRNNFAGVVTEAVTAAGDVASVDVGALQEQLNDYTKDYTFGARRTAGVAVNPVERIAISLAKDAVKKGLKKKNLDPKDYTAEQLTAMAKDAVGRYPHFMEQASAIHEAKKAAGAETLIDIAA